MICNFFVSFYDNEYQDKELKDQTRLKHFDLKSNSTCNIYITKLQSKFHCRSDTGALTPPKHANKFHATKTKKLVASYQTLLFCNQSKAKLLLINGLRHAKKAWMTYFVHF